MSLTPQRSYGRSPDQLRPTEIEPGFVRTATGSALISMGETRVICTASAQASVPRWLAGSGRGWVTAEYGMLPASTGERKQRDVTRGRPDGRTVLFRVLEAHERMVLIDMNHPLAGETLHFAVDVVDIRDASTEELEHGHAHGPEGHGHSHGHGDGGHGHGHTHD